MNQNKGQCQLCLAYIQEIKRANNQIKSLERQVKACLIWIKNYTGVDMSIEDIITSEDERQDEENEENKEETTLTKLEMAQLVYSSIVLEYHQDMFNYGRTEGRKMAESL